MLVTNKTISWFLVAVMLAIVLLPTHMHLQHEKQISAISHEHAFDYHVIYEQHDHDHSEVSVLDTTSDFLIKQLDDNPLSPFILFSLILILARLCQYVKFTRNSIKRIRQYYYYRTPPLRAPPQ